jgi:hypothetical protein
MNGPTVLLDPQLDALPRKLLRNLICRLRSRADSVDTAFRPSAPSCIARMSVWLGVARLRQQGAKIEGSALRSSENDDPGMPRLRSVAAYRSRARSNDGPVVRFMCLHAVLSLVGASRSSRRLRVVNPPPPPDGQPPASPSHHRIQPCLPLTT